jgi:hypothetical protein
MVLFTSYNEMLFYYPFLLYFCQGFPADPKIGLPFNIRGTYMELNPLEMRSWDLKKSGKRSSRPARKEA